MFVQQQGRPLLGVKSTMPRDPDSPTHPQTNTRKCMIMNDCSLSVLLYSLVCRTEEHKLSTMCFPGLHTIIVFAKHLRFGLLPLTCLKTLELKICHVCHDAVCMI